MAESYLKEKVLHQLWISNGGAFYLKRFSISLRYLDGHRVMSGKNVSQ